MNNVEKIKPNGLFTNYIYKAIPLAFDESMSYYETLCALKYYLLNSVIPALNNNADSIIEVQNLISELQNYINNYFDNLDVQEEINQKLDEMVINGDFDTIMEQIFMKDFVYAYDNIETLQSANIPDNVTVRLNGKDFINDGLINYYKINKQPNQLFNINGVDKVNAYYNNDGEQITNANNTAFLGITLPAGYITISSNKNLNKLIGFTSDDFSQGNILTSPNIGTNFTFNNDGTYLYFGFYCSNSNLENLQVMINKGQTALPYEDYFTPKSSDIILSSGQIASLIENYKLNNSFIAEDIEITEHICNDENTFTKYWITKIPRIDSQGNINELKLGFANNENYNFLTPQTAKDFSALKNATVVINAGVSWNQYEGHIYEGANMHGLRVLNHVEISNNYEDEWYKKTHYALGIKDDGTLLSFGTPNPQTGDIYQSYQESQQLGCKYVTSAFTPIMINGISQKNILPYTNKWVEDGELVYYQRQVIGQNTTTKDIYIITSNGKGNRFVDGSETKVIDKGLTLDYCITVLQSLGCDFAYQLDEGGSTSTIYRGMQINEPTDDSGKSYRKVSDFLYVSKKILTNKDKDIAYLNKEIGNLKFELKRLHNKLYLNVDSDYTFEIQRYVNNILNNTLNLRSSGLQYYDNINSKTLFNIDTNGLIETQFGKNGLFTATAKGVYNDNDINKPYSNVFIYPYSQNDAPYENNNALVLSFVLWDNFSNNQMIQLALPHAGDPTTDNLKPKYRTKTYNSSSQSYEWSNWFDIG